MENQPANSEKEVSGGDISKDVTNVLSAEQKQKAEELKTKANDYFKAGNYSDAIQYYTDAINTNPGVAAYYGNRSFAYIRTESLGAALQDASKALELDRSYIKGYYRRATANFGLGRFKQALKDFETVVKYIPSDKDAKAKFTECNQIVNRLAFEKAISVEDTKKSVVESLDIDSMVIEDSYDGPRLENNKVTQTFVEKLLEHFFQEKKLEKKYVYQILIQILETFKKLPSLCDITIPEGTKFTVCGDVHGQFYDLYNIFQINGLPSKENPYLFNGDFVDRGSFSIEVILTLFSYKLLYPDHFHLSRGNHETETMNQLYGFFGEVKAKYTSQMAELFTEIYNWLPLAQLINKKVLVMHGGLFSDDNVTIEDIRKVERNKQPPDSGIMCDLLWSDPQPQLGRSPSSRGMGIHFGPDITQKFLEKNNLDYIIRSHQVKDEGYELEHNGKCITIFSAPNYCDKMGNKGAIIKMGSDLKPEFVTFEAAKHPDVKPMAYANSFLLRYM